MKISTHLDVKPFQVSIGRDLSLPTRKWNHIGTVYEISARSVAYRVGRTFGGDIVSITAHEGSSAFLFPNGTYVRVGFGSASPWSSSPMTR